MPGSGNCVSVLYVPSSVASVSCRINTISETERELALAAVSTRFAAYVKGLEEGGGKLRRLVDRMQSEDSSLRSPSTSRRPPRSR